MKLILTIAVASLAAGCAVQPKVWTKPGATEDQFQRDKMNCRNYGMQSAMANGLAGNMFVEVWVNRETETCLQNLGYMVQTPNSTAVDGAYVDQIKTIDAAVNDLCNRAEYQPLVQKTPCGIGLKQPSMEMLTDKSKITKQQRVLFDRFTAERTALVEQKKALMRSNGSNNAKAYLQKYETTIEPALLLNKAELYDGKISWGQFNKEILRLVGVNATLKP